MTTGQILAKGPVRVSVRVAARAHLALLRPANLVTSAADVLAGYGIAGLPDASLGSRLVASVALYGGGVVLNDFFDRRIDTVERPERPIPSGRVRAQTAAGIGFFLLAGGLAAAFLASASTGAIALLLATAILLYNVRAKHVRVIGPVMMGTCRGLNLLLGLSASQTLLMKWWFLSLLPLVYIGAITALSAGEVHGGTALSSTLALTLVGGVLAVLVAINSTAIKKLVSLAPFLALLLWRVGPPLWRACRNPEPKQIRAAVHAGVVSLIVFDAALASGYAGIVYSSAILTLLLLAGGLGRIFPVT